jgi:uncharacterized protein
MPEFPHSPEKIEAKEADYLYVQASQIANAGSGLFTALPIYKNEIISVFAGEILDNAQAKIRADKNQDAYFISMLNGNTMDSMHTDCFAKYANDAEGKIDEKQKQGLKNNAIITMADNDKICIVAVKNIKANEEIFVSYGKDYWAKK